jgi:iron(II)-dependent oxidoreductase
MTREADGMVMVYVPGGTFLMGSDDDVVDYAMQLCNERFDDCQRVWFKDEQPAHSVTLDDFWIDRTEVSNAQYQRCIDAGACHAPTTCDWGEATYADASKAHHPVICVDWTGAQAYCAWAGARLPTEAEWEYAARGPDGKIYPWGDTFDGARLNYCDASCSFEYKDMDHDDGYEGTAPVESFESGASWCGALNTAGNVLEWTSSLKQGYPYQADDGREDPTLSDRRRVLRGGAWYVYAGYARSALRFGGLPTYQHGYIGLRCVVAPRSSSQ